MEEKLQQILNDHGENITEYKRKKTLLLHKIEFCQSHNFKEEERIARLEFDATDMIIYRYSEMHKEIQELLNDWLS